MYALNASRDCLRVTIDGSDIDNCETENVDVFGPLVVTTGSGIATRGFAALWGIFQVKNQVWMKGNRAMQVKRNHSSPCLSSLSPIIHIFQFVQISYLNNNLYASSVILD